MSGTVPGRTYLPSQLEYDFMTIKHLWLIIAHFQMKLFPRRVGGGGGGVELSVGHGTIIKVNLCAPRKKHDKKFQFLHCPATAI